MINSVSEGGGKKKRRGETEHLTAWKFIRQDGGWGWVGVDVRVDPQADGSLQKGGKWKSLIYIVLPPQWRNALFFVDLLGQASCYVS